MSGSSGSAARVTATLPDLILDCGCAARKRPCRHALSLAMLAAREEEAFVESTPPPWVVERLGKPPFHNADEALSTAQALALHEAHLARVRGGMEQFERWLKDRVHGGLAGLPGEPVAGWNEIASRLNEAGCPVIAQEVRGLRGEVNRTPAWPEALLRRLGRLYLLAQGFRAYETLPVEAQADLRGAAGWFADPAHPGQERISDRWLVLATTHTLSGQWSERRTWLYGLEHQRFAFLSEEGARDAPRPPYFSGTLLEAALCFAPGGWPLRAILETAGTVSASAETAPRGHHSLENARQLFGKALSVNPWLRRFPLLLRGVRVQLDGDLWVLRDEGGYLMPLPLSFLYGWHLQLMCNQAGALLFGEWDGVQFTPLAIRHEGQWLAVHILRGQK